MARDLPEVLGDRQQLQQVVLNLVTNAVQALAAMPPGLPRRITVVVEPSGDRVVVRVADTGLGIPADVLPQVFSPFFTTKPFGEGTGLGLFISYGLVEGHGGTLTAESRPGAGATFTMALPRATGKAVERPADAPLPAPERPGPARRILVVDHDPAVRRTVAVLFAREGHEVDAAGDGDAALRMAREREYDLLIVERRAAAEGTPFLEALQRVRPEWKGRVLVSTAEVQQAGTGDPSAAAVRLLRKPFNLRDLRSAANAVWTAARPS
jgi:two-component system cell cycle sensor histidine kinase/response regulator CckA